MQEAFTVDMQLTHIQTGPALPAAMLPHFLPLHSRRIPIINASIAS